MVLPANVSEHCPETRFGLRISKPQCLKTCSALRLSPNEIIIAHIADYNCTEMEGSIVKAIVCSVSNGPYEVKDVRVGSMLEDEIAVRMVATGVCHTDFACTNVSCYSVHLASLSDGFVHILTF